VAPRSPAAMCGHPDLAVTLILPSSRRLPGAGGIHWPRLSHDLQ
jgi:hypothetical protein